jgi:hypothetical protein
MLVITRSLKIKIGSYEFQTVGFAKKAARKECFQQIREAFFPLFWKLSQLYFFSSRAFGAAAFFIRYVLSDPQRLDRGSLDGTRVEEQVASFTRDETKPFVKNHFFDRSLRHRATPSNKNSKKAPIRKLLIRTPFCR